MARKKFRALRDLMEDAEYSVVETAERIGRGKTYLSLRLNGMEAFGVEDILRLAELLEIPPECWVNVFIADYANGHYPELLQPAQPRAV